MTWSSALDMTFQNASCSTFNPLAFRVTYHSSKAVFMPVADALSWSLAVVINAA